MLGMLRKYLGLRRVWTTANERILNIRTTDSYFRTGLTGTGVSWWRGQRCDVSLHDDNYAYATMDYWYIYKARKILELRSDDVFYDIGCGKGRAICVFARVRMRRCVGVELLQPLCQEAERNAGDLRGRKTPITVVCSDASTADLSDGTVYFLFNPFGEKTMEQVLRNIERSLRTNPRTIRIAYHNSQHEHLLDGCAWLERHYSYRTAGGLGVRFWKLV